MMVAQHYCLRWNNHQQNLLSFFDDLLHYESFVDVTLVCEEGEQLRAHKMVLSACSPYFQNLFQNTVDRHPMVVMRDIRAQEMTALLEFMYKGEVSVDQSCLPTLLRVAEGLKVKGLAEVSNTTSSSSGTTSTALPTRSILAELISHGTESKTATEKNVAKEKDLAHVTETRRKRGRVDSESEQSQDPLGDNNQKQTDSHSTMVAAGTKERKNGDEEEETEQDAKEEEELVAVVTTSSSSGSTFASPSSLSPSSGSSHKSPSTRSFSEMSVRGLDLLKYAQLCPDGTYLCIECRRLNMTKHFKNKYSFQRHAFLYHEGVERKVFPCPLCNKEFSRPDKMKSHMKTAHDCVIPRKRSKFTKLAKKITAENRGNHEEEDEDEDDEEDNNNDEEEDVAASALDLTESNVKLESANPDEDCT